MCVLGAARRGVVPVLINATLLPAEREALVADADPAITVRDRAGLDALVSGPRRLLAPHPLVRPMHYTSGTTGRPKGVWSGALGADEARAQFEDEADLWHFDAGDTHLVCSPLYHSVSVRMAGAALLRGGRVVVLERFDAEVVLDVLERLRPTTTFMAPTALHRVVARSAGPGALRHAAPPRCTPGHRCSERLKRGRPRAGAPGDPVGVLRGRPMAEFTVCSPEEWLERPGTVGRARPGRRLDVDDDGAARRHPPGFARFVVLARPRVHWAWAWRAGSFTVGDLGRLDDAGYLFLEGRRDDLVISGGVNVYPVEVEAALAELPGVEEVAVFGVGDDEWGCQRVRGGGGQRRRGRPAPPRGACRPGPYKRPKVIFAVGELPHTATGKLRRRDLPAVLGLAPAESEGHGAE